MIKTFPEKLKSKVNTWGKKNPRYKSLYRIYEKVMLFFYHIGVYFSVSLLFPAVFSDKCKL